jgi:hemolysin III
LSLDGPAFGERATRGTDAPEREFMSPPVARPLLYKRTYSPAEIVADGAVHAAALIAGAVAFSLLFAEAPPHGGLSQRLALAIYAAGYFIMFGFSFAYNMAPESPLKRVLRRCDHSAIYLMIAGTYSALLSQVRSGLWVEALAVFVWTGAIVGAAVKLFLPGRFERVSTGVYLGLGWSAIVAIRPLAAAFPAGALALVIGGGVVYSLGVIFYRWQSLKFQNAIWHAFVAVAAACQFAGIVEMIGRTA